MIADLLALAAMLLPAPAEDRPAGVPVSCDAEAGAIVRSLAIAPGQVVGEFRPRFALTDCLADRVAPTGSFVALVDGGDRVANVAERLVVQRWMKRDPARYGRATVVKLDGRKPRSVAVAGNLDRIVVAGTALDVVGSRNRAVATLRAMGGLVKATGLLGVVVAPAEDDGDALFGAARDAGWEPTGQATIATGAVVLSFRRG